MEPYWLVCLYGTCIFCDTGIQKNQEQSYCGRQNFKMAPHGSLPPRGRSLYNLFPSVWVGSVTYFQPIEYGKGEDTADVIKVPNQLI